MSPLFSSFFGSGTQSTSEYDPRWEVENRIARSGRPGRAFSKTEPVAKVLVDDWISKVQSLGVSNVICLLGEDQLPLYNRDLNNGLIEYYESQGLNVINIQTEDHKDDVLSDAELAAIHDAFMSFEGPVLIHCSAGKARTGKAIEFLLQKQLTKL